MPSLETLNQMPAPEAESEFFRCCGSKQWAREMAARRPFRSENDLFAAATSVWNSLAPHDWLEAFSQHPRIGATKGSKWSKEEQSKVGSASADVLTQLAEGNKKYDDKFGFVYLVCATGKTAEEMLTILNARLKNDSKVELAIAAAEQDKITQIRLRKLLKS